MDNFNTRSFSERLKEARLKRKMKITELAAIAGVSTVTISSYEREEGAKVPSLDKAFVIAQALGVSLDWLCGVDEQNGDIVNFNIKEYLRSLVIVVTEAQTGLKEFYHRDRAECQISICNEHLFEFLDRLNDLMKVFHAGTLTEDLYLTCVEKLISDFSKGHCIFGSSVMTDEEAISKFNLIENLKSSNEIKLPTSIQTTIIDNNFKERDIELFLTDENSKY